jgi:pimeloyl-ACP methyl ester carboxylesterase
MASASANVQLLRLPDGRRLGYAEYGARDGRPLLFFHGTPGACCMAGFAEALAQQQGIRIIAPERPGFGRSDFQERRRIGQWADDVAALADALALDRFAVAGVSGGGPYVAACASKLPDRVRVAGIVSGMGPLDEPRVKAAVGVGHRATFGLIRQTPWLGRAVLALAALAMRHVPQHVLDPMAMLVPVSDRAILARPEVRAALVDDLIEGLRAGGRGAVHELVLFSRPWDFPPEEIRVPVHLWHGEADIQVPVAIARRLAARIPTCRARFVPGAGHFWLFDHCAEVLATLCPP